MNYQLRAKEYFISIHQMLSDKKEQGTLKVLEEVDLNGNHYWELISPLGTFCSEDLITSGNLGIMRNLLI